MKSPAQKSAVTDAVRTREEIPYLDSATSGGDGQKGTFSCTWSREKRAHILHNVSNFFADSIF